MTAKEWLKKNNVDLSRYHGNIGDYDGNMCIECKDGTWKFLGKDGNIEPIKEWFKRREIYE